MALLSPANGCFLDCQAVINLGRGGGEGQRLLGRRENQWMADGCHLGTLSTWDWILAKGRASETLSWWRGEGRGWLENKQTIVMKTRTNGGGHNCDLGPLKRSKVIWGYRIPDFQAACKTLSTLICKRVYRTEELVTTALPI